MAQIDPLERPRIVVILGPTGIGKSKLGLELGEEFGGEIISADSMQVYRYMDIGTAKPTLDEQKRVRHHMIDMVTPDQPFHAGLYRVQARRIIDQLCDKGEPIWVVGGTGLYIKALIQGLFSHPKIDPGVRKRLKQESEEKGGAFLYQRLEVVDPATASRIHPHDLFRTLRALEVFDSTGVPISFLRDQHRFGENPYDTLKIGLETSREVLYRRVEQRVDQMIEKGFLQEVKKLTEMGYGQELKPMQSLGYKQMVQFLSGEMTWVEAVTQIKSNTKHYAKRQWTWFRADPDIRWRDGTRDRQKMLVEITSFLRGEDKRP